MKLSMLNFDTNYYYKLNGNNKKVFRKSNCFNSLYYGNDLKAHGNNGILGVLVVLDNSRNKNLKDNYCLISLDEVKEFLEMITKITRFEFNIIELDHEFKDFNGRHIVIETTFKDKSKYQIKVVACMIRYLYESYYAVATKTAFMMKDIDGFRNLGLYKRWILATSTINNAGQWPPHNLNTIDSNIETSLKMLKKKFNDKDSQYVEYMIKITKEVKRINIKEASDRKLFSDIDRQNSLKEEVISTLKTNKKLILQ